MNVPRGTLSSHAPQSVPRGTNPRLDLQSWQLTILILVSADGLCYPSGSAHVNHYTQPRMLFFSNRLPEQGKFKNSIRTLFFISICIC
jgi:hypothetical protein